ncbi:nucleotide-diphospho-sugar transferase [Marasmius fiardii PR-910]|nr:nucleotide-diphospho-sugar transferase [Marasmius fiardii PR-910]
MSSKTTTTLDEGPKYDFTPTQDWFSGQVAVWEPLITELRATLTHSPRALEIGSWEGRSAVYLLNNLCNNPSSLLVCIDHFDLHHTTAGRERYARIQRNLTIPGYPFRVIDDFSVPALYRLLEEEIETATGGFDFVYIDGSHEADDTFLDAELAWRLTRPGALVVFDDYEWTTEPSESIHHPKRGIDGFLDLHRGEYKVLHRGYQIIVQKTREMRIGFLTKKTSTAGVGDQLPINIAFCTDSSYAMPATVAIISTIEATPGKRLSVYVVDCGMSTIDKEKMTRAIPASYQVTLNFIELPPGCKGREDPSWAKIDALAHLPIERVLLLDSDILVRHDLGELWGLDLEGKVIGAARDIGHPLGHDGVQRGPYFNAGVLLIDLARIRARLPSLLDFIDSRPQTRYKDQDVLNEFFRREWREIQVEWNATGLGTYANMHSVDRATVWTSGELNELHRSAKIVHFSGPVHPSMSRVLDEYNQPWTSKPWGYAGAPGHPYASDWFEVLLRSTWKDWVGSEERKREMMDAEQKVIDEGLKAFKERVKVGRNVVE